MNKSQTYYQYKEKIRIIKNEYTNKQTKTSPSDDQIVTEIRRVSCLKVETTGKRDTKTKYNTTIIIR